MAGRRAALVGAYVAAVVLLLACTGGGDSPTVVGDGTAAPAGESTSTTPTTAATTTTTVDPRRGSGNPVVLAFAGDINFEGRIGDRLAADPSTVMREIAPILGGADLTVVNLETAITERGTAASKEFTFRAPSAALDALRAAGVDVASEANNHGMDFGAEGLQDSLAARAEKQFPVIGIGQDIDDAFTPYRADDQRPAHRGDRAPPRCSTTASSRHGRPVPASPVWRRRSSSTDSWPRWCRRPAPTPTPWSCSSTGASRRTRARATANSPWPRRSSPRAPTSSSAATPTGYRAAAGWDSPSSTTASGTSSSTPATPRAPAPASCS